MPIRSIRAMCVLGASLLTGCTQQTAQTGANVDKAELSPNGIALPQGYKDWRLIATSHRTDNDSLRAILGNDIAVDAARLGQTNPWPDGAILAKLVWKDTVHEDDWPEATVPGKFLHAEFMVKDEKLYPQTGGWGFARWLGEDQKPYGEDDSFARYECFACHTPMKKNDYVFSRPAVMP